MKARTQSYLKKAAMSCYFFGAICLIAGLLITAIHYPVQAAEPEQAESSQLNLQQEAACTPPGDWDGTVRLKGYGDGPFTREWTFEVDEPEMDVVLEFYYYQDHDKLGCPFDCSLEGVCQIDEEGIGESPLGPFEVTDGKIGFSGGVIRQSGRLAQGTYNASFEATGHSVNIGLRVHKKSLPADTPAPTNTPTALPPTETPTTLPPTATEPAPSGTPTEEILPPEPTATHTPPAEILTATPTEIIQPPAPTATNTQPPASTEPTPTDQVRPPRPTRTPTPPATLPPPSVPTQSGQPPVLVPVTGGDLGALDPQSSLPQTLILKLGAALLGLALVLHGFSSRAR